MLTIASQEAGANNPPGPIEFAGQTMAALSSWMADHPVIQTHDDAKEAKLLIDRAKAALVDVETERDNLVRPLNEQVTTINGEYKKLHNSDAKKPGTYDKVLGELKARLGAFLAAEEAKRQAEAAEALRKAQEAERLAREAEEREREAIANAAVGELGVDMVTVTHEADAAFDIFERASRFATVAVRDTKVKLAGGFGKAASLRTVETLILDNPVKALMDIGVTDKIRDAILSGAREYRTANGKLPDGVTSQTERVL